MPPSSLPSGMTFLNDVAEAFPEAVSLAAGRPTARFFDRLGSEALIDAMERFVSRDGNDRPLRPWTSLLQYGRTAGVVHELVAAQLRVDEGVLASPDRVLVTSGCQEALALCIPALCQSRDDVLLVCNPTYIGATGAADAARVQVVGVPGGGDLADALEQTIAQLAQSGRTARAFYLIPEFDNPTGRVLDEKERLAILRVCARHRIVVLEDNPYGMFRFDGRSVPPMATLDGAGSVIYLSTYSKTLSPTLRMGAATLPETLFGDRSARQALWTELVERKSYTTVNSSQLNQAVVGGILLQQGGSLRDWVRPSVNWYRGNET